MTVTSDGRDRPVGEGGLGRQRRARLPGPARSPAAPRRRRRRRSSARDRWRDPPQPAGERDDDRGGHDQQRAAGPRRPLRAALRARRPPSPPVACRARYAATPKIGVSAAWPRRDHRRTARTSEPIRRAGRSSSAPGWAQAPTRARRRRFCSYIAWSAASQAPGEPGHHAVRGEPERARDPERCMARSAAIPSRHLVSPAPASRRPRRCRTQPHRRDLGQVLDDQPARVVERAHRHQVRGHLRRWSVGARRHQPILTTSVSYRMRGRPCG